MNAFCCGRFCCGRFGCGRFGCVLSVMLDAKLGYVELDFVELWQLCCVLIRSVEVGSVRFGYVKFWQLC
jgi:hypothetical protein